MASKDPSKGANSQQTKAEGSNKGWALPSVVGLFGVALAAYFAYYSQVNPSVGIQYDATDYAARTEVILKSTPLIDGHNDLPFLLRLELHNQIYDSKTFRFNESRSLLSSSVSIVYLPRY